MLHHLLAGMALVAPGLPTIAPTDGLYLAQTDHVLGTSLDLKIVARSYAAAVQAEATIRSEIDRLTLVLSSHQPDSEFSRWQASLHRAVPVSADLLAVLTLFEHWQTQTGRVINAAAAGINQLWQQAAQHGTIPSDADLTQAVAMTNQPHWLLDPVNKTATRLTNSPLQLHTFTKSYVLEQAANRALALPDISGVVLNSGGDLVVRGAWTESVLVADPRAHAENDRPVARLAVNNRAVATSGGYRRGVQIGTDWFSHLVNPLTGWPTAATTSATVIHPDAVTAGALATAFAVLSPAESEQLAAIVPHTDYLLVTANGQTLQSSTWPGLPVGSTTSASTNQPTTARLLSMRTAADKLWKADQELLIQFALSPFEGRYHRPFVAVWVENERHEPVRNLALWYNKPRWLPELRAFYAQDAASPNLASITGATRSPGEYSLSWDGKDNAGQYVKQAKYTVCIEAAREHGTYQLIRYEMDFNGKPKQQTLPGNVEIARAALDYRQK